MIAAIGAISGAGSACDVSTTGAGSSRVAGDRNEGGLKAADGGQPAPPEHAFWNTSIENSRMALFVQVTSVDGGRTLSRIRPSGATRSGRLEKIPTQQRTLLA